MEKFARNVDFARQGEGCDASLGTELVQVLVLMRRLVLWRERGLGLLHVRLLWGSAVPSRPHPGRERHAGTDQGGLVGNALVCCPPCCHGSCC